MRNKIILLAFVALAGCSNVPFLNGNSVAGSAPVAVTANTEKALTIAHIAYNGLAASLTIAVNNGVLHGGDAAKAKVYFDKAGDALLVADKADAAANENGVLSAISDAEDAITSASAFAKGN